MATAYLIERAQGPVAIREQIVDVVISRFRFSESYFSGVRVRLPRMYDLWRGIWTGRFHPHKNNVHIPLIYSAIWADAARKASTSLALWPVLLFQGYGPDDMPVARKQEALISAQMKDMDLFMKEVDTFVTADLYGTAITQLGWRRDEPYRIIEDLSTAPLSGKIIRSVRKGKIVTFDGPDTEAVDRLDFFPQPGVKNLRKMKWVIRRSFLDLDEVRALVQAGMFDKAEFERLVAEGGVNAAVTADIATIKRFQVRTGMDDESARWMDRYARPVEILEMWGTVPNELTGDGVLDRVITIANRRYVLRNKPNPHWHGQIPFISYSPTPDPHYFDAPGKAEIVEKLQIVANRYINQTLDAADLIIDPAWFYDRASNLQTRNMFIRPGRFIPIDGNPSDAVFPVQANLSGLAMADQKIDQMRQFLQMGTGIVDDAVAGMDGPDRQTAREFVGRREAAGTRLLLESRIYEENYLERLGNMMVAMNKQYLEAPVTVNILGDSATLDPVTGAQIPQTRETLTDYDMMFSYTARACGATTALSKSMQQQNLIQLLQGMSGMPQIFGAINAVNFWRGVFRAFEIPNINEIFMQQGNPLAAQLAQATGGQGGLNSVPTSGQIAQGAMPQAAMGGGAVPPSVMGALPGMLQPPSINNQLQPA